MKSAGQSGNQQRVKITTTADGSPVVCDGREFQTPGEAGIFFLRKLSSREPPLFDFSKKSDQDAAKDLVSQVVNNQVTFGEAISARVAELRRRRY